ncbi:tetratricopeptide repeat protein [Ktedonobacter sp. SOSP1-85]|uniref:FxSxx-COOH system tetratricopeptide repeat protein n=1 Tax=Ktedonobacter sp. SOSP1-85 TaxID=2778367 RepID=UPI0019154431|nr:FxSxx-COOH system tetratricopeptide repeat protein [Ktedonobacter sp. SOSP1-85]GHO76354.1 tetratricopeptide repeat protein [Ktedonobacter sp. SOSP1-85]
MEDSSMGKVHNNGQIQGQILNGQNHHITQHYYAAAGSSSPPERVWNVPYQRNPYFTGREDLLSSLHEQLHAKRGVAPSQAISGLGGVGKTQLAVEYAYRYREEYSYILWVRAESEESLVASYITLAHELNLPQKDERDQSQAIEAVKRWLRNNGGWLFIFDNADEPGFLPEYVPTLPRGHCLYTTRASTLGRLARSLEVESFTPEQGALFLLRRAQLLAADVLLAQAPDQERELALQMTREFGGLPLALDQAGAYIEETQTMLSVYWQMYQQRRAELLKRRGFSTDYPESVATTWSLSFERVEQQNQDAAELLRLCALLAPDAIPEDLLLAIGTELGRPLASIVSRPQRFNEAIGVLMRYSFVKRDQEHSLLSMHRLVQIVLREGLGEEEARTGEESFFSRLLRRRSSRASQKKRVLQAARAVLPQSDFEYWAIYELWLPHILACVDWSEPERVALEDSASLLQKLCYYLRERGRYTEAASAARRALTIREQELGEGHRLTGISLNELGSIYQEQGKYTEAEPLLKQGLVILQRKAGSEDPSTLASLNNLAILYHSVGQFDLVETLYEQVLDARERKLGAWHPDTAGSLNNLGMFYHNQGRHEEAEPLLKRALEILQQAYGELHPDTAASLNNLASLYYAQGRRKEAMDVLLQSISIKEGSLGSQHPSTAISQLGLAKFYQDVGRYAEAKAIYDQALPICERSFSPEHLQLRLARINYSALRHMMSGARLAYAPRNGSAPKKKKPHQRRKR